jgi:hypothetical protein
LLLGLAQIKLLAAVVFVVVDVEKVSFGYDFIKLPLAAYGKSIEVVCQILNGLKLR